MVDTSSSTGGTTERIAFHGQTAKDHARQHVGNVYHSIYKYTIRKRKSDDTLREDQRNVALLTAAANGHTPRVSYLIHLGTDLDYSDQYGFTALHHAALSGFDDTVETLLLAGSDVGSVSLDCGTPMHLAALKSRSQVMELLFRFRANASAGSRLLGTPLHCACYSGDIEAVRVLLRHEADPSAQSLIEFSLLDTAPVLEPKDGRLEFADCQPLLLATRGSHPDVVDLLASAGASIIAGATCWSALDSINATTDGNKMKGWTPLHESATDLRTTMCNKLLELGAPVDARTEEGVTPLIHASHLGNSECVELLLQAGAGHKHKSDDGNSAMGHAVKHNHVPVMRLLMKYGASIHQRIGAIDQTTMLHLAAQSMSVDAVRLLIEHGALPNELNDKGENAIDVIVEECVEGDKKRDTDDIRRLLANALPVSRQQFSIEPVEPSRPGGDSTAAAHDCSLSDNPEHSRTDPRRERRACSLEVSLDSKRDGFKTGNPQVTHSGSSGSSQRAGPQTRSSSSGDGEPKLYITALEEMAYKQLLPEETELLIRKFERAADIQFSRTYQMGKSVKSFALPTQAPQIGLVLLPGVDLTEVNRLEYAGMVSSSPDQRVYNILCKKGSWVKFLTRLQDAAWRVGTAGGLLSNITLSPDLTLVTQDLTFIVAYNASRRNDSLGGPRTSFSRDAVTIKSENVHVVHDTIGRDYDLSATLVEVNISSLWSLLTHHRMIIINNGPQLTPDKATELLEQMIDATRRFCVRSPILFRMSTRLKVIKSNHIRYGVDNGRSFQTFTTSRGIQELITASSSYFLALGPSAGRMDKDPQQKLRPKFLQMLTLLLSLLDGCDLQAMSEFLLRTFGIKPDRPDIELLFLRIMPLTSINSKVFLQGLVPAIDSDGWELLDTAMADEARVWMTLMKRLARRGYLLPGSVEELGHRECSWIVRWPEGGIHSSTAFSRLQYHGKQSTTFNEVPTGRFNYEPGLKEILVHMTDDETYSIHPADYERISTLAKGLYSISRCGDNSICDLDITETLLNRSLNEAVDVANDAIRRFKSIARSPQKQRRSVWAVGRLRQSNDPVMFSNIEPAPRLTRNQAILDNTQLLAVAYRLNGRDVPKGEAMRHLAYHLSRVSTLFNRFCEAAGQDVYKYIQRYIERVIQLLALEKQARASEVQQPAIVDAPIARAFGPDDAQMPALEIWHGFTIDLVPDPKIGRGELLRIQAECDYVQSVVWHLSGQRADVTLVNSKRKLVVAPLKPVNNNEALQDEELSLGDLVLLAGRYLIVAKMRREDWSEHCIMTNWLEIKESITTELRSRRNYDGRDEHTEVFFV